MRYSSFTSRLIAMDFSVEGDESAAIETRAEETEPDPGADA